MPFHGEAGSIMWELVTEPEAHDEAVFAEMAT